MIVDDFIDETPVLDQVMAWCYNDIILTHVYDPYGIARMQTVKM